MNNKIRFLYYSELISNLVLRNHLILKFLIMILHYYLVLDYSAWLHIFQIIFTINFIYCIYLLKSKHYMQ